MGHSNSIFNQIQQFLPHTAFQAIISKYNANYYTKSLTCHNQLMVMMYAQLTGKDSLRDIELSLSLKHNQLYHLGINSVARSSLSRANSKRDCKIFENLFYALLKRTHNIILERGSSNNRFKFNNPIYAIDSSYIDTCLSLIPWAKYQATKGAIKIHPLLNLRSQIPEFMVISDGKKNDIAAFKEHKNSIISTLRDSSKNSSGILVFDRGYIDYSLYKELDDNKIIFVTRAYSKIAYKVLGQHNHSHNNNSDNCCLNDEIIEFTDRDSRRNYPKSLRKIVWLDKKNNRTLSFITNDFKFNSKTIAKIYKARWDIEIFFKWIKQNLKIKTFFGTSKNAVMTQIWVAMIAYLLISYIKYQVKCSRSLLELTRIIRESIFERIHLIDIIGFKAINIKRKIQDIEGWQTDLFGYG